MILHFFASGMGNGEWKLVEIEEMAGLFERKSGYGDPRVGSY